MIAFEVKLNGKKLTLAGAEDMAVLSAAINCSLKLKRANPKHKTNELYHLYVGGLTSNQNVQDDEVKQWIDLLSLNKGDEIKIRIVDVDEADNPTKIEKATDTFKKK